ncbi:hypothetical protein BJY04DRAFT_24814 [Aspergillus karnatakaensis]|uniref:uncharacterized protein n=1 Tax=Aspergillus karnatakaensis TaxID=1810916 RepID=UPI003CCD5180
MPLESYPCTPSYPRSLLLHALLIDVHLSNASVLIVLGATGIERMLLIFPAFLSHSRSVNTSFLFSPSYMTYIQY